MQNVKQGISSFQHHLKHSIKKTYMYQLQREKRVYSKADTLTKPFYMKTDLTVHDTFQEGIQSDKENIKQLIFPFYWTSITTENKAMIFCWFVFCFVFVNGYISNTRIGSEEAHTVKGKLVI